MQHHLQISEKDAFSCQSQSSLTNICPLHLPIPFQHWPLSPDRFFIRSNLQLSEGVDFAKNWEEDILPCEKDKSQEIFRQYHPAQRPSMKKIELDGKFSTPCYSCAAGWDYCPALFSCRAARKWYNHSQVQAMYLSAPSSIDPSVIYCIYSSSHRGIYRCVHSVFNLLPLHDSA